ncbi:MAG TPA: OmpA family protein [Acetobacteraceae bacterium]|nr:OmpA family protein [Acetobacteraceae bacterium]
MKLRNALLAATVLAVPVGAKAQAISGLYVGAGVGWNYLQNRNVNSVSNANIANAPGTVNQLNFGGDGWLGLASIGWGFGNGVRAEVEGNYRWNHVSGASGTVWPGGANSGFEQKAGVMVNVLYDFEPSMIGLPISPYIGVGVGWQNVDEHGINIFGGQGTTPNPGNPAGQYLYHLNSDTNDFAYQAILGVAVPLTSITPGLALTAEYRFLGTAGSDSYKTQYFQPGSATQATIKLGNDFNHSVLVGFRYAFNAAPPPPPPAPAPVAAPAPAPSRTYLVFFDWDRADLTQRARQIIAEAAQNSTRVQYTRIVVNGYTDTSGTPAYNLRLSVRRANAVKAELIRDGVPANVIETHGYGETHLLVPTGPGVREPQNRRVEIILR